ncbi:hypothetical protein NLJ89_g10972 [Agrocybe chaxingu]|uniref:Uncharacterized protein n=1 Tax=Agrocybe chaxingu TaxID=84603 RepID=A0A9W8JMS1_9AGAR|nr:hypothetical protein NLJ89_g10972 [Agrocybe chaxingu]
MPETLDRTLSSLSIHSTDSQQEDDWDRSLTIDSNGASTSTQPSNPNATVSLLTSTTPRNSIVFPANTNLTPGRATRYSSDEGGPRRD